MHIRKNKIKVLHAMRQGQIGGGEAHVFDMVSNLNRNEFEPVVLSFTDGPIIDQLRKKKITVYVVDTLQPFHFSTFNNVQAIIRCEEINILHAHGTRALSNTIFTAKALGLPVIYTVYGWAFHSDQYFPVKKAREITEKLLIANVDLMLNVSTTAAKEINLANQSEGQFPINYGVNLEVFSPYRPIKDIRSELGLSTAKITVGYVDRITKQKDPFTFIRAVASLKDKMHALQFIMIGDGDLKKTSINLANELGVKDKILFHSPQENKVEVLKAIDIYSSTSLSTGLKPELMEAMAMHKAIVATRVNGSVEIVRDNINGMLIPCGDAEQLASKWLQLANDEKLRDELGENAYNTIRKEYDLKTTVEHNERIYYNFMKQRLSA